MIFEGMTPMKRERINCPVCRKRMLDIVLDGNAALKMKCNHCGNIIEVTYDNTNLKITKRVIGMNTS